MSVLSYNEITPKRIFIQGGDPYLVLSSNISKKDRQKASNNVRIKNLRTGNVVDRTLHQSDSFEEADIESKPIEYIYSNKGEHWFHPEGKPGERFSLPEEAVGNEIRFVTPKSTLDAVVFNDEIISIKFPIKVNLVVKEAMPAVKGNTSQGATKEVTLETGVVIQAPMFINEGDIVSINTETGAYSERIEKA